jgi:hypothetical protein
MFFSETFVAEFHGFVNKERHLYLKPRNSETKIVFNSIKVVALWFLTPAAPDSATPSPFLP